MNRFFGPLARRVDAPWKMYPVGILFGLGFDTATEVALLVLSGTAVASGLPFWAILSLPMLFAAGMSLFDTIDGCFMNFAYGWAFSRPVRKVYYNLVITGLSVAVAFFIGTIELLGLLGTEARLAGRLLARGRRASTSTPPASSIVGLFVVTWAIAVAVWRFGRIEERWTAPAPARRLRRPGRPGRRGPCRPGRLNRRVIRRGPRRRRRRRRHRGPAAIRDSWRRRS